MDRDQRVIESTATESTETRQVYLRLWQMVERRKWRITFGAVIGLLLAVAFCALFGPWYQSTAQLLIIKKHLETSPILGPNPDHPPDDSLSTHMLILSSSRVVGQAITQSRLLALPSFQKREGSLAQRARHALSRVLPKARELRPEDKLTQDIIDALVVNRDSMKPGIAPSNEVLTVTFQGHSADDCPKVLSAIVASYQRFLKDTYRNVNTETLELINRAQEVLQKDLQDKEKAYGDFLQKAPPVWNGKEGKTVHQDRLFEIDAKRSALGMRRVEIEATLAVIDKARKDGQSGAALANLISGLPTNREILIPTLLNNAEPWNAGKTARVTLEEVLQSLRLDEAKMLETLGQDHPDVQALRSRIVTVRDTIMPPASARAKPLAQSGEDGDLVHVKLNLLKQELTIIKAVDAGLAVLFQREQKEAQTSFTHYAQDESHRKAIERSQELYGSIIHRLREIDSVKDFGGYDTDVIGEPRPGKLALKKYGLIFGLALFTGLLGGSASAYRAEASDKSFRTSGEIRHRLRLPVLGHIPSLAPGNKRRSAPVVSRSAPVVAWSGDHATAGGDHATAGRDHATVETNGTADGTNGSALDPLLCSFYYPDSAGAEAYRAVRSALYVSTHAYAYKVIQVSSPDQGDGKTSLAANLAISIAQSGKRVILIDANFRQPRLDRVYGLSNRIGLSSVLTGHAELLQAVQPAAVSGLAILPCGPLPPNPAELLSPPRLKELLDSLRQAYDCVLVDTPPLLVASDPCMVAAQVDAVLLVIRNCANSRPHAERALELLDTLQARVLGVVVNAVDHRFGLIDSGYVRRHPREAKLVENADS